MNLEMDPFDGDKKARKKFIKRAVCDFSTSSDEESDTKSTGKMSQESNKSSQGSSKSRGNKSQPSSPLRRSSRTPKKTQQGSLEAFFESKAQPSKKTSSQKSSSQKSSSQRSSPKKPSSQKASKSSSQNSNKSAKVFFKKEEVKKMEREVFDSTISSESDILSPVGEKMRKTSGLLAFDRLLEEESKSTTAAPNAETRIAAVETKAEESEEDIFANSDSDENDDDLLKDILREHEEDERKKAAAAEAKTDPTEDEAGALAEILAEIEQEDTELTSEAKTGCQRADIQDSEVDSNAMPSSQESGVGNSSQGSYKSLGSQKSLKSSQKSTSTPKKNNCAVMEKGKQKRERSDDIDDFLDESDSEEKREFGKPFQRYEVVPPKKRVFCLDFTKDISDHIVETPKSSFLTEEDKADFARKFEKKEAKSSKTKSKKTDKSSSKAKPKGPSLTVIDMFNTQNQKNKKKLEANSSEPKEKADSERSQDSVKKKFDNSDKENSKRKNKSSPGKSGTGSLNFQFFDFKKKESNNEESDSSHADESGSKNSTRKTEGASKASTSKATTSKAGTTKASSSKASTSKASSSKSGLASKHKKKEKTKDDKKTGKVRTLADQFGSSSSEEETCGARILREMREVQRKARRKKVSPGRYSSSSEESPGRQMKITSYLGKRSKEMDEIDMLLADPRKPDDFDYYAEDPKIVARMAEQKLMKRLYEQKEAERKKDEQLSISFRDRLDTELPREKISELFKKYLPTLQSIKRGETESWRHTEWTNGATGPNLTYAQIEDPFLTVQIDYAFEEMREAFYKDCIGYSKDRDYVTKVLMPEFCIRMYQDLFDQTYDEAWRRIRTTPLRPELLALMPKM